MRVVLLLTIPVPVCSAGGTRLETPPGPVRLSRGGRTRTAARRPVRASGGARRRRSCPRRRPGRKRGVLGAGEGRRARSARSARRAARRRGGSPARPDRLFRLRRGGRCAAPRLLAQPLVDLLEPRRSRWCLSVSSASSRSRSPAGDFRRLAAHGEFCRALRAHARGSRSLGELPLSLRQFALAALCKLSEFCSGKARLSASSASSCLSAPRRSRSRPSPARRARALGSRRARLARARARSALRARDRGFRRALRVRARARRARCAQDHGSRPALPVRARGPLRPRRARARGSRPAR